MFQVLKENDRVIALNDPDLSKDAVFLIFKSNPGDLSELKAIPPAEIRLVGTVVARIGTPQQYKVASYRQATLQNYEAIMAELLKHA